MPDPLTPEQRANIKRWASVDRHAFPTDTLALLAALDAAEAERDAARREANFLREELEGSRDDGR